jgi:EipB-like
MSENRNVKCVLRKNRNDSVFRGSRLRLSVMFEEPTVMLAFYARLFVTALMFAALVALDPSLLKASPANSELAGAGPLASTSADAADRISLASHRAVYELTLLKSTGSKSPTAAHGRIAFDFTGSPCEGYVQNFRQLTELQPAEGPTRISDMHSATFEDADGRTFEFKVQTTVDNGPAETIDGKASRSADGALWVNLAKPKHEKFKLDPSVVFPTEHLKRILAAAEAGQNLLQVKVYDGSESGEKFYDTTTYIGRPTADPALEKAVHIPELDTMRRWPVSISYFEAGKTDDAPSYVLSFDLYENGISRALRLDYGDFVLAGDMTSLDLLKAPACAK